MALGLMVLGLTMLSLSVPACGPKGQVVTPKSPKQTVAYAEAFAAITMERATAVKPMLTPSEVEFLTALFTEAGGYLEEAHRLVLLQPDDTTGWQTAVEMAYQVLFQVEAYLREKGGAQ